MTDPMNKVTSVTAAVSAMTSAVLGVDYFAIVWGFIGAMFALINHKQVNKFWAIFYVSLASLIGAAIGSAAYTFFFEGKPIIFSIVLCAIGGFGAKQFLTSAVRGGSKKMEG